MIKLFQYKPCWGLLNASPFCMKIETFLQLVELPYKVVILSDPRKAPKGKLPYIDDAGTIVSDSSLIIEYLIQKYSLTINNDLTAEQQALATSLQRLVEEHLYWTIVYSRWIDDAGWKHIKADFFTSMPSLLRKIIPGMIRRGMRNQLQAQGMGRHTQQQVYAFALADLRALQSFMHNDKFLLGTAQPTVIDVTVYSFITNIMASPNKTPMRDYVCTTTCFKNYCSQMQAALEITARAVK